MRELYSVTIEKELQHVESNEVARLLKEFKHYDGHAKFKVEQEFRRDDNGNKSFTGYYNLTFYVSACSADSNKAFQMANDIISDIQNKESE